MALDQKIYELRRDKLKQIEALGQLAYPYRYETTHTIPQILDEFSAKTGPGAGIAARRRQRCRTADVDPRAGQGRLRSPAAGRQAAADLRHGSTPSARRRSSFTSCSTSATTSA